MSESVDCNAPGLRIVTPVPCKHELSEEATHTCQPDTPSHSALVWLKRSSSSVLTKSLIAGVQSESLRSQMKPGLNAQSSKPPHKSPLLRRDLSSRSEKPQIIDVAVVDPGHPCDTITKSVHKAGAPKSRKRQQPATKSERENKVVTKSKSEPAELDRKSFDRAVDSAGTDAKKGMFPKLMPPELLDACVKQSLELSRAQHVYSIMTDAARAAMNTNPRTVAPEDWADGQRETYGNDSIVDDIKRMFELMIITFSRLAMKSFRLPYITKSCHQCQYQGVWHLCQCDDPNCEHRTKKSTQSSSKRPLSTHGCSLFVCNACLQEHYSTIGVSAEELRRICPVCRGICICRRHLRESTARIPAEMPDLHAQRLLQLSRLSAALLIPRMQTCFTQWQREARYSSIEDLLKIPHMPIFQERILCSRCQTSISNIYRTCGRCDTDLCVSCCAELRQLHSDPVPEPPSEAAMKTMTELRCPNPACTQPAMVLQRLLGNDHVKDLEDLLRRVSKEDLQNWRIVDGVTHACGMLDTEPRALLFEEERRQRNSEPAGPARRSRSPPAAAAAVVSHGRGTADMQPAAEQSRAAARHQSVQAQAAAQASSPVKAGASPNGKAGPVPSSAHAATGPEAVAPQSPAAVGVEPAMERVHGDHPCAEAPPPKPYMVQASAAQLQQTQPADNVAIAAAAAPKELDNRLQRSAEVKTEPCAQPRVREGAMPPQHSAAEPRATPAAGMAAGSRRATARLSEVSPSRPAPRPAPGASVPASATVRAHCAHPPRAAAGVPTASPCARDAPAVAIPVCQQHAIKVETSGEGPCVKAGMAVAPSIGPAPCSVAAPVRSKFKASAQAAVIMPPGIPPPAQPIIASSQQGRYAPVAPPPPPPPPIPPPPAPARPRLDIHPPPPRHPRPRAAKPQHIRHAPASSQSSVPMIRGDHKFRRPATRPVDATALTPPPAHLPPAPMTSASDVHNAPGARPGPATDGMPLPGGESAPPQPWGAPPPPSPARSTAKRVPVAPGPSPIVRRQMHRPVPPASPAPPRNDRVSSLHGSCMTYSEDDMSGDPIDDLQRVLAMVDPRALSQPHFATQRARGAATSDTSTSTDSSISSNSEDSCGVSAAMDGDVNIPMLRPRAGYRPVRFSPEAEAATSPDEVDIQQPQQTKSNAAACTAAPASRKAPRCQSQSDDDGAPPPKRAAPVAQASPSKQVPRLQRQPDAGDSRKHEKRAQCGSWAVKWPSVTRPRKRMQAPAGAVRGPQSPLVTKRRDAGIRTRPHKVAGMMAAPGYIADSFTAARGHWAPTEDEAARIRALIPTAFVQDRAGGLTADQWGDRLRLASWEHDASKGECYLLCVDNDELRAAADPNGVKATGLTAGQAADVAAVFWREWSSGKPVLVKKVQGQISWEPKCMRRATTELGNNKAGTVKDVEHLRVQRCDTWAWQQMKPSTFFTAYARPAAARGSADDPEPPLLKLKDYPPADSFASVLPRHLQDFMGMLPVPHMTRTDSSTLNLATTLGRNCVPTDLGPKCYIALGRPEECGPGDSVTRCHLDMSDAVNIMLHVPEPPTGPSRTTQPWQLPGYQGAGAVWHIWRREDLGTLRQFMRANQRHFVDVTTASGRLELEDWEDPVHSQRFMLTDALLQKLLQETGVQPWQFEQNPGEAVFIPAGCAHQVRNLMSSIKVAVDFVSPHNIGLCLHMAQEMRAQRDTRTALKDVYEDQEFEHQDSLQAETILVHGARAMHKKVFGKCARAAC